MKTYKVVGIDHDALKGNLNLEELVISKGIEFVGKSAFEGCNNLKSIELPQTSIYVTSSYQGNFFCDNKIIRILDSNNSLDNIIIYNNDLKIMKYSLNDSQNKIKKDNNKLKYTIIVSIGCLVIASIVIAIVIKIKQSKKNNEIDEEPMLQNNNQYTEFHL